MFATYGLSDSENLIARLTRSVRGRALKSFPMALFTSLPRRQFNISSKFGCDDWPQISIAVKTRGKALITRACPGNLKSSVRIGFVSGVDRMVDKAERRPAYFAATDPKQNSLILTEGGVDMTCNNDVILDAMSLISRV